MWYSVNDANVFDKILNKTLPFGHSEKCHGLFCPYNGTQRNTRDQRIEFTQTVPCTQICWDIAYSCMRNGVGEVLCYTFGEILSEKTLYSTTAMSYIKKTVGLGLLSVMITTNIIFHYDDVIMSSMASQITSLTIVYSTIYSGRRSKKSSKPRVTGLCEGNSPQRASNAENVSIWWRHHVDPSWFNTYGIWGLLQYGIRPKRILDSNLAKTRLPMTFMHYSVAKSFWNFAQSTTISVRCANL